MASYKMVETRIKECHIIMEKAGIRNIDVSDAASPSTIDLSKDRSPQELKQMIAHMESKLDVLGAERDQILMKTKVLDEAIKNKHQELQQTIDDNISKEQRYIAIRSRDPIELQNEIRQIKAREIELTNRIRSLQSLPMYKNDQGTNALIKLNVSSSLWTRRLKKSSQTCVDNWILRKRSTTRDKMQ